jgi:alkylation response protein AidB-like acyl-CoA dehydrogenase
MGRYLYDRAVTILGGTSEIQRNIMARAMLGI